MAAPLFDGAMGGASMGGATVGIVAGGGTVGGTTGGGAAGGAEDGVLIVSDSTTKGLCRVLNSLTTESRPKSKSFASEKAVMRGDLHPSRR